MPPAALPEARHARTGPGAFTPLLLPLILLFAIVWLIPLLFAVQMSFTPDPVLSGQADVSNEGPRHYRAS